MFAVKVCPITSNSLSFPLPRMSVNEQARNQGMMQGSRCRYTWVGDGTTPRLCCTCEHAELTTWLTDSPPLIGEVLGVTGYLYFTSIHEGGCRRG